MPFPFSLKETFDPQFVSQEEEEAAARSLAKRRSTIKMGGGIQMALLNAGKLKADHATSGIAGAFREYFLFHARKEKERERKRREEEKSKTLSCLLLCRRVGGGIRRCCGARFAPGGRRCFLLISPLLETTLHSRPIVN